MKVYTLLASTGTTSTTTTSSGSRFLLFLICVFFLMFFFFAFVPIYKKVDTSESSISILIILCLVTFGIYGITWIVSINRQIKYLDNDNSSSVGEMILCFWIPFYIYYWCYSKTQKIVAYANRKQVYIKDNAIIYLLFYIFGLNLISLALMQNDLNSINKQLSGDTVVQRPVYTQQQAPVSYAPPQWEKQSPTGDAFEKISELAKLRDTGLITEEEYNSKKAEIMSRI